MRECIVILAGLTRWPAHAEGSMTLTYTDSRAICVQDPSAMGGPVSGDPFQSSFMEPQAGPTAPTAAAVRAPR